MGFPNLDYSNSWNLADGGYDSFNLDPVSPNVGAWQPAVPGMGTAPMTNGGGGPNVPMGNWWDGMLGKTENGVTTQGWGGMALGAASGLTSAYLGMKQYGLAKDTLKHNKEMFSKNFDAQRRTTNASLQDRQAARVASNPGAYQSVSAYMDQNGIR